MDLNLKISSSCLSSSRDIINIKKILNNNAINVELKATPRLAVIDVISPDTASLAFPKASPIPLTVPRNPIEGIAQEINLINETSICKTSKDYLLYF